MSKQVIVIIVVGLIAFAGGIGAKSLLMPTAESPNNRQLPEFNLPDLNGKSRAISEWQGKVRVINFWATWCPPCLKEMPEFNALQKQYADKDLQVIGIALDESQPVKDFVAANNISYPILLGETQGMALAHSLGNVVNAVPFTVIVDKSGVIVKSHMGELQGKQLIEMVTPYL
jgi:thiol-disulfide isomerase/thioredoxin